MSLLTEEQRQAIDLRGVAVGVSAAAGSGKTRVLTERFLAELEEVMAGLGHGDGFARRTIQEVGEILHQLVAITFTHRAARELSHRVRRLCEEKLRSDPATVRPWLYLWRILDFARIGTIHNFCSNFLRRHGMQSRIDPGFEVLEDGTAQVLIAQTIDELLQNKLAGLDAEVLELARVLSLESLAEVLIELVNERARWYSPGDVDRLPAEVSRRWVNFFRERRRQLLGQFLDSPCFRTLCEIAEKHTPAANLLKERCQYIRKYASLLRKQLEEELSESEIRECVDCLRENAKVDRVGKKHGWPQEVYDQFRHAAEQVREWCKRLSDLFTVDQQALEQAVEPMRTVLQLAHEAVREYEALKHREASLDFSDLVAGARMLAEQMATADRLEEFAGGIRLLLVDEFQDTDRDQEALLRQLCGPQLATGKLFFVGDVKQSIYRFRRADPTVFANLRKTIPEAGRLALTKNFRSQPGILQFVNAVFADAFGPEYEPLVPTRLQLNAEPVVEFLWAVPDQQVDDRNRRRIPVEELRQAEAELLARRIRRMLDSKEKLVAVRDESGQETLRPVQPGDVAILFRALSDIDIYERALRDWGIDYYLVGGQAFYAQQEIYDLLNLLRAVSDPADAVSLAGVLRSPFFSCDDQVLWWLGRSPAGFVNAFYTGPLPDQLSHQQKEAVLRAREVLCALRELKDRLPVAELIGRALEWTGYDALVLTEFLGERKLANLRKLIELAREFDRPNFLGLDAFILRLSDYVAHQSTESLAPLFWETADVVRLMTVHQAKGLEFPVVIVADIGRGARGPREVVFFSEECGPYVPHGKAPAALTKLVASAEEEENTRELTRLFYVACTRARDYLILSAGLSSLADTKGPWISLLAGKFCLQTGKYLGDDDKDDRPLVKLAPDLAGLAPPEGTREKKLSPAEILEALDSAGEADVVADTRYLAPIPADAYARRAFSFTALAQSREGKFSPVYPEWSPATPLASLSSWGSENEFVDQCAEVPVDELLTESAADEVGPGGVVGLFVHEVLRWVDFRRPENLRKLIEATLARYDKLEEPVDEIEKMIRHFLASPRGVSLAQARKIYQEVPFLLPWPPESQRPQRRYFRGLIDCLYQDAAGRWVILDYKTNHVDENNVAQLAAHYTLQLRLYAMAVESALRIEVAELVLCFLRSGQERQIPWDERARAEVRSFLDRFVAQLDQVA